MVTGRGAFVGRSRELAGLQEMFDDAMSRTPRTVVVAGEAGIGKTRLATEFLAGMGDDVLVIRGQCVDSGSGPVPGAAPTDVMRSLAAAVGEEPGHDVTAPAVGVLAGRLEAEAAQQPVVVVLEDLHWSDDATRTLVATLARSAAEVPLLVLLTVRTDDVGPRHPLRPLLTELERARLAVRFDLGRLAPDETRDMARALSDGVARSGSEALVERSAGVPFYVEELARFSGERLPESLRAILLLRYHELEPDAQAFCRAVATGGVSVPHDVVSEVLAADPAPDAGIRGAVDAHVLLADADGFTFRHALVQEAVYTELLPGERQELHAAYARVLERGPDSVAVLTRIADHWWRARDGARALSAAVRGMRAAREAFAASTAVLLGERALELWDQVDSPEAAAGIARAALLYQVAELVREDTRPEEAMELGWQALDEWPEHDTAGLAEVLGGQASIAAMAGRDDGPALTERALALLAPGEHQEIRARLLLERARSEILGGRSAAGLEHAYDAHRAAKEAGNSQYVSRALSYQATALAQLGEPGAPELFEAARTEAGDDWLALVLYYTNLSDAHLQSGRFEDAARVAQAGSARARELGASLGARLVLESNLTEALVALGEGERGRAIVEQWAGVVGQDIYTTQLHLGRAWLMLWQGDTEGAEAIVRDSRATWERDARTQPQVRTRVAEVLGQLALVRGDPEEALQQVDRGLDVDPSPGAQYVLPLLTSAAHAIFDLRAAGREVDDAPYREALAGFSDWPTFPLWSALFAAELGEGPWSEVADRPGQALLRPYALLREGAALVDRGDRLRARDRLAAAESEARAIGIGLIATRAAALMERAGLRTPSDPAPGAVDGPESLTPREEQVLALVAEGLTNKQVGDRLFISAKTASVHVSAILRKLGVTTRTEAAVRWRS